MEATGSRSHYGCTPAGIHVLGGSTGVCLGVLWPTVAHDTKVPPALPLSQWAASETSPVLYALLMYWFCREGETLTICIFLDVHIP